MMSRSLAIAVFLPWNMSSNVDDRLRSWCGYWWVRGTYRGACAPHDHMQNGLFSQRRSLRSKLPR